MGFVANIRRDVRFARGLFRLLKRIKPIELDSDVLLCDDFEEAVDKFPDNIAIDDGQRTLTYRDLDAMANRFGHWAKNRGLRRNSRYSLSASSGDGRRQGVGSTTRSVLDRERTGLPPAVTHLCG